ncbi:8012_t:CDS:1, partial [Ambispora gerdemannii]
MQDTDLTSQHGARIQALDEKNWAEVLWSDKSTFSSFSKLIIAEFGENQQKNGFLLVFQKQSSTVQVTCIGHAFLVK